MLSDTLQAEFRRLLRACAPEIPQVYTLDAADLQGTMPRADCMAWHTGFNHDIRQWLIDRHEWRGILPVVVIDVEAIRGGAADVPFTWTTLAHQVFVHELAHAVPYFDCGGRDIPREPTAERLERHREHYAKWAANPTTLLPWAGHDDWFTRAALHLRHRAIAEGFDIPLHGLCAGWGYAMSPAWVYAEALGDEPERLANCSFDEIEATPAPAAFTELFETNKFNYHYWNQSKEKQCLAS
jgi:hypothetical protein